MAERRLTPRRYPHKDYNVCHKSVQLIKIIEKENQCNGLPVLFTCDVGKCVHIFHFIMHANHLSWYKNLVSKHAFLDFLPILSLWKIHSHPS